MPRDSVELEVEGAVATIRLDNPPLNTLTGPMRHALKEAAEAVAARSDVRAVMLCAAGERAFSVGSDITTFPHDAVEGRVVSESEHAAYRALESLPQPLVAALRGDVLGGGLELALTADLRVADAEARFGLPEVRIGVFASGGGTQRLPALVGAGRASLLLLTGRAIDAGTALAWGLVSQVTPVGQAESAARELAEELAALPKLAMSATKRCVREGLRRGREAGEAAEIAAIAEVYASRDAQEGARAFLEKRAPRFVHR
ncbi:enoyl-CoA hydratase/isomerase family protein [Streptomyces fuscigenes]|uniref:enoyl-CoA hydratase/isomerase family protein n=1 Tax=Streptomyces fuscigenes TaxID=1528880 RepID=UPI001F3F831E|nr:enoyl-CoA hydratase-related protein [Streptomyces fuscigenes]MCF3961150.1 enoyl-CoA hydratase-related protein [Streptomyces fuscigenes]